MHLEREIRRHALLPLFCKLGQLVLDFLVANQGQKGLQDRIRFSGVIDRLQVVAQRVL